MSGTSNPESASDPLSLEQLKLDAFRRMENHSPALMLPRLIMSQHLHQRMRAAIKRQDDGHRYQMSLLGVDVANQDPSGISLAGDTINNIYQKASGMSSGLGKLALAASLLGLGGAGAYLWDALKSAGNPTAPSAPPAVIQPYQPPVATPAAAGPQDWRLGVQVTSQP